MDFFLYFCILNCNRKSTLTIERQRTLSPAAASQGDVAGGKSGQHEPPYFLTGRRQEGKRPVDSKCHRKINRPSAQGRQGCKREARAHDGQQ